MVLEAMRQLAYRKEKEGGQARSHSFFPLSSFFFRRRSNNTAAARRPPPPPQHSFPHMKEQ